MTLTGPELEQFSTAGFVAVRGAVPASVVGDCQAELNTMLRSIGADPDDPATWDRPVVRFGCPETPPFAKAGTQPILWQA